MPNENNNNNTTTTEQATLRCNVCSTSLEDDFDNYISENSFENYDTICNACQNEHFRYSERRECYVHNDDWDRDIHDFEEDDYEEDYDNEDEDRPEASEHIFSYMSGSFRNTTPLFKPYESESFNHRTLTLGIEDEVQVRSSSRLSRGDLAYNITQHDLKNFAICKEDSSIGYGFEIVSKPATFEYHKTAWDIFFENSAQYLRSYKDQSTGLHIHVNQSFFSRLAVGKILEFINSDINKTFIDSVSGRTATHYCSRNNLLKIKDIKTYRDRGAFHPYVQRTKTHEFRCFSGNVKKESFFKTLEFVVSISQYAMSECTNINPNYFDFISYVRSNHFQYPYLFNWLIKNRYLKNESLKRIKEKTIFYTRKRG